MVFLLQIGQFEDFRLIVGKAHIVDSELLEVAYYDPAGLFRLRQISAIAPSLLERGQHSPVRLALPLFQVDLHSLLLDQNAGSGNVAVNIFRGGRAIIVVNLYPFLKFDSGRGLLDPAQVLQ